MGPINYWVIIFNWKTWNEFLSAGGNIVGFRESRRNNASKINPGDRLLCYLVGISRFIGLLEASSKSYEDKKRIWEDDIYPVRLNVITLATLTPETAVPIKDIREDLSIFHNLSNPNAWTAHLRGSPRKWKRNDGDVVAAAILYAFQHPNQKPFDEAKLKPKPKPNAVSSNLGPVIIPNAEALDSCSQPPEKEPTEHTEIQWLLLNFGSTMGLKVWVARNDKNKQWNGNDFNKIPKLINKLPLQFDETTNKIIELIDVLWLEGNSIVAAFEIESTTSIYSGLLRLSDLIAMQPNLNIPLFIVAPDDRRDKVISEVNRPTFSRLSPPLYEMCRYISFSSLRDNLKKVATIVQYLKSDYLDELSESCELDLD